MEVMGAEGVKAEELAGKRRVVESVEGGVEHLEFQGAACSERRGTRRKRCYFDDPRLVWQSGT